MSQAGVLKTYKPAMDEEFDEDLYQSTKMLLNEIRTHSPFFGVLATELWLAGPSKSVPTIGVSQRGVIVYNEKFLRSLTPGERIAVVVHEALHMALDYWVRFKGHNHQLANQAHDFSINDIIVKSLSQLVIRRQNGEVIDLKIRLPEKVLWDPKFENMSGEEIYNILYKGVAEKAQAIREKWMAQQADPNQKAENARQKKIQRQLRESLIEGGKLMSDKEVRAKEIAEAANKLLRQQNDEFNQALKEMDSFSLTDSPDGEAPDREANNPLDEKKEESKEENKEEKGQESDSNDSTPDQPEQADKDDKADQPNEPGQNDKPEESSSDDPKADADESAPGDAGEPGDDQGQGNQPSADSDQSGMPGDDSDQGGQPGADGQPQGEGSSFGSEPHLQSKQELKDKLHESLKQYMDQEKERIEGEIDKTPNGKTRDDNLQDLNDELDKIADEYVDKMTDPDPSAREGDKQPGENDPANESDEKGEPGEGQSEPGDAEPGNEGEPGEGQGEPGEGQGEPGEGQGAPCQGQLGNEQPGDASQPGQGQPGQSGASSGPISENEARRDVRDEIKDLMDQIGNSLNGKDSSVDGLDKRMASGEDMMNQGAMEEAMKQMSKELGENVLDGDISMDCSDIPGNPFKNETSEESNERRKEMLSRAAIEDMQSGGNTIGTLPGWFKSQIEGILHPPMTFDRKIKKFLGPYGRKNKRSFAVSNKRNTFFDNHMIRPGLVKDTAMAYVLLDTSGSMMNGEDANNLRMAMGLVSRLATSNGMELKIIQNDWGVTRILTTREALDEVRKKQFEVHGQGGSNFVPAFDMIWKEMKESGSSRGNPIIVFTDGAIDVPDQAPKGIRQQVLWVTRHGQRAPTTKWGEHIELSPTD